MSCQICQEKLPENIDSLCEKCDHLYLNGAKVIIRQPTSNFFTKNGIYFMGRIADDWEQIAKEMGIQYTISPDTDLYKIRKKFVCNPEDFKLIYINLIKKYRDERDYFEMAVTEVVENNTSTSSYLNKSF